MVLHGVRIRECSQIVSLPFGWRVVCDLSDETAAVSRLVVIALATTAQAREAGVIL